MPHAIVAYSANLAGPCTNVTCLKVGHMHDTVMLSDLLGWDSDAGEREIVTDYFTSSGTAEINAEFHL